jgi:glycosyltransferase involved in cell wall biosynthesis
MKISIITVNKNNREGLLNTLQSVIYQTFNNYELIVIDGLSDDGSKETIQLYADKIKYWISEKDNGVYHAMNKGIDKAMGKYCLFLNSGDTLKDENSLSDLYKSEGNEDIIFGNIEQEGANIVFPEVITLYNLRWGTLPHPATLIKRELLIKLGKYNENNKIASDWEFWLKAIILNHCSYKHINQTIARVEQAGLSAKTNFDEGYRILYSIFPRRILDDYDRFKEIGAEDNHKMFNWLSHQKFLFRCINWLYKFSGKGK